MLDEFQIFPWVSPPSYETNDFRYLQMKAAGFNYTSWPIDEGALNKESNLKLLNLCEKHGLKTYLADDRIYEAVHSDNWKALIDEVVEDYKGYPALYAYDIKDEPGADDFSRISEIVSYLKIIDPTRHAYINLFPNYASPNQLNTATYEEYVDRFIQEVKPFVISYDHYHFFKPAEITSETEIKDERQRLIYEASIRRQNRPGYFENIELIRQKSLQYDLPFIFIALLVTHGPYRDLTEAELRWEAFQALAYGAKSICWFTYWNPPPDSVWNFRNAVIDDGVETEHYQEMKRINPQLKLLGDKLFDKKTLKVYHVGEERESSKVNFFQADELIKVASGGNYTLGYFTENYILIANKDFKAPTEVILELTGSQHVYQFDKNTGAETEIELKDNKYILQLSPGDAELIRIGSV
ncbi:hypothetical protein EHS13_34995 [Paenibacillus psychroresistens]|uniref:Glycoside hydrolase family 42 N-terminal domain-containing protein n=1 Tax=Paenibacillus psychroresistens TaxID=1778678 RepID=A0A6B8RV19_9BACL|nr:hypothetical protein [Paenibacillus psychroresistens]QGQ99702.1 hypothetical protein EHS13_34995 [Paenibacillus psychroresistens]